MVFDWCQFSWCTFLTMPKTFYNLLRYYIWDWMALALLLPKSLLPEATFFFFYAMVFSILLHNKSQAYQDLLKTKFAYIQQYWRCLSYNLQSYILLSFQIPDMGMKENQMLGLILQGRVLYVYLYLYFLLLYKIYDQKLSIHHNS